MYTSSHYHYLSLTFPLSLSLSHTLLHVQNVLDMLHRERLIYYDHLQFHPTQKPQIDPGASQKKKKVASICKQKIYPHQVNQTI